MDFRIADTFTASLDRLTGDEQKAVKTTAFDLQMNPAHPGLQFHKLDRARDKNFWSVRASRDIRVIVHKTDASLMLCYADHHDAAYAWAFRHRADAEAWHARFEEAGVPVQSRRKKQFRISLTPAELEQHEALVREAVRATVSEHEGRGE